MTSSDLAPEELWALFLCRATAIRPWKYSFNQELSDLLEKAPGLSDLLKSWGAEPPHSAREVKFFNLLLQFVDDFFFFEATSRGRL